MSAEKKAVRETFRNVVFNRDGNKCKACGWQLMCDGIELDAHHITDRNLMPNGGYVPENGISLCPACHEKAEMFHNTGISEKGFSPDDLYKMIGSSYDKAVKVASKQR